MKFKKGDLVKYRRREQREDVMVREGPIYDEEKAQKLRGVILGTKFTDFDADFVHVKWTHKDELEWVFPEYLCLV
jgi:hypothetical protein